MALSLADAISQNNADNTAGRRVQNSLARATPLLANQGFRNLADMLSSDGRTAPGLFNRQRTDVLRSGEAASRSLEGSLARGNLQNFAPGILGQVLEQTQGGQLARIGERESALAEQRKRSDLGLLAQLIINPSLDLRAQDLGVDLSRRGRNDQQRAALLGALGTIVGGIYGGPAGAAAGGAAGQQVGGA